MESKLSVRRNIAPLYKIANDLESHLQKSLQLKNNKIYQKFSANFNGSENPIPNEASEADTSVEPVRDDQKDDRVTRRNWKSIVNV